MSCSLPDELDLARRVCQVLAVVNRRLAKSLLKRQPDIEKFARRVEVGKDRIATWPGDVLAVFAEHPSIFYDLMTDQLLNEVRFPRGI